MRELIITHNEENQRLDRFLGKYLNQAGKGFIGKIIRKKTVKVNGKKAEPSYKLLQGDLVELFLSEDTLLTLRREKEGQNEIPAGKGKVETPISIAYEDDRLLVWNKPWGVLTHGSDDGVVESAIRYLVATGSYKPEEERVFVPSSTNRLDKNTSGLVFIPKDNSMRMVLNEKWKKGEVQKYYLALVHGVLTEPRDLTGFLVKDANTNQSTISLRETSGSKAVRTSIRPVESSNGYTLLEIQLHTGRSHQIRAHLQSIGAPIAGDPKYGDPALNREVRIRYGLGRQFLHNHKTIVMDYEKRGDLMVEAPLPKDLERMWTALKRGE